jgi:kinesin family protein 26
MYIMFMCIFSFVCPQVKVMLRVSSIPGTQGDAGSRFLSVDPHRKQITIFDPSASGYVTSANRRTGIAAPKMFAFDAVFSPDDSLVSG